MKLNVPGLFEGRLTSSAKRLERMERDACGLLGLTPPASPGEGLAAAVLAEGGRGGGDPEFDLVRRLLTERLGCPKRALGLIGVGLLHGLHHPAGAPSPGPAIGIEEVGDLEGLADRLTVRAAEPRDAARAGSFVRFMLNAYGAEGLTAFARALEPGTPIDAVCRKAVGKSAPMVELHWAESLSHEQPARDIGQFVRWSLGLLLPYRGLCALLAAGIVAQAGYAMMMPAWLNTLFDAGINAHDAGVIWRTLAFLVGGFLFTAAAGVSMDFAVSTLGPKALNDLRSRVFDKLLSLSPRAQARFGSGDIVSVFASDMFVVENAVVRAIPGIVSKLFLMIGSLITAVALDWRLALVTGVMLTIAFTLPRQVGRFAVKASYARKIEDGKITGFVKETAQLLQVIRTLDIGGHRRELFDRHAGTLYAACHRQYLMGELTGRATNFAVSAAQLAVIGLGAIWSLNGTVSGGVVVAYIGLLLAFGGSVGGIAALLPTVIQAVAGWQRIETMLNQPSEETVTESGATLDEPLTRVALRNVSFSYTGERLNLDGVTLETPVPRRVALVGPSGSGKSTIINLLSRNYDAMSGSVLLNDTDIRAVDSRALRALMAVVNQDTTLFEGSIRYNIRLGRPEASDAEVEQAARAAEIHGFIASLPNGYDTDVGEGGKLLSGGQRQRIVIARAFLRDPQILLLDEATSALDAGAEAAINETLNKISANRTLFSVTHRLASCPDMDLICAFRDGKLVESGTHAELLELGGVYAGMWEKQADIAIVNAGQNVSITLDRLRKIPLFASVPDAELERIRDMLRVEEVEPGTVLIQEGSTAGRFHILARGAVDSSVRLADGSSLTMEVLEVGDFFGEFALLEGIPNPTTCTARLPCLLLTLSRQDLRRVADLARPADEQTELEREIAATLDRRLDAKLEELVWRRLGETA